MLSNICTGDFPVVAIGSRAAPSSSPAVLEYMQLLLADIHQQAASPGPLNTIFFGGGTPSLVPPDLLAQVMDSLQQRFGISPTAEVSMEADPGDMPSSLAPGCCMLGAGHEVLSRAGTFDLARLQDYQRVGVRRFSVGVQAFDEVCIHPAHAALVQQSCS